MYIYNTILSRGILSTKSDINSDTQITQSAF